MGATRTVLLSLQWLALAAASGAGPSLETSLGPILGRRHETVQSRRTYYSFTGVPYAQPPVGNLRLRNPVPHKGWGPEVLDATKKAPECKQVVIFSAFLRNQTFGQEDCLYLNIYTPTLDANSNLPVLVYIHGGGFRCGAPPSGDDAPSNFMEEDVVLVTVHYRVGTLGFLSLENDELPGNFGLKDQALAVQWVSKNIKQFGGNPESITVFGESAGGASVHYLLTSPLSRDYIKGGIAESGLLDGDWALAPRGKARRNAKELAKMMDCDVNDGFLSCLQEKDPDELTLAEVKFLVWDFDPAIVFQPVIERDSEGAFMTQDPRKVPLDKPLITGIVPGEGILKTAGLYNQDESVTKQFTQNMDEILPSVLFLEPDSPRLSDLIAVVKARYFRPDLSNYEDLYRSLEELYRDVFFIYPMHLALQRHIGPKYGYIFTHRAEISLSDRSGPKKYHHKDPCHGDELLTLFNWTNVFPHAKGRKEDVLVSNKLVKLWVNFAKYQTPTPEGSPVIWKEYGNSQVLQIGTTEDTLIKFPYDDVVSFWEKAYQIISPPKREEL